MSSSSTSTKKYPAASEHVFNMLGFNSSDSQQGSHASAPEALSNLPTAASSEHIDSKPASAKAAVSGDGSVETLAQQQSSLPAWQKILRAVLPYVFVFILGLALYFFFFSGLNLTGILPKSQPKAVTPQQSALQTLEKQDLAQYRKWIDSYFYEVSDSKILDPEADLSGNGLTNFEKYLLNLNPKSYDTLGLGMSDTQALAMNIDPLTGGTITDSQKAVLGKYVDLEVAMNRLTLANLQRQSAVAGANTLGMVPDGIRGGTRQVNTSAAVDNAVDINTSIPGVLEIPDLKIKVPVVWSQTPDSFEKDLQNGVIHYPGTAMPGQIGTTYIAGHSSNYIWAKGSYNQIFSKLGDLANNTSFKITVTDTQGKSVVYNYVVTSSKQYSPTDQAQFQNTGQSTVALSTCWPVGSTAKRLVVTGLLTQVVK